MNKPKIETSLIEKFTGRVHAVDLIGQLSMRQNGRFDVTRGKERATRLINLLEKASEEEVEKGTTVSKKRMGGRVLVLLTDDKSRLDLAKHYFDSEEVRKLCSVTSLSDQKAIIAVIRNKIATGTLYKKSRYVNSRAKAIAALKEVTKAKNYKELPKPAPVAKVEPKVADSPAPAPTYPDSESRVSTKMKPWIEELPAKAVMSDISTAIDLIKADLDMASATIKKPSYLLITKDETQYCVINEVYIEAYRQANSLPKSAQRVCRGVGETRPTDSSDQPVGVATSA